MTELIPGDIFTRELKLHDREAFKVMEIKMHQLLCKSRTTNKELNLPIKGTCFLLRHEQ
jgi:hypothetical protein